MGGLRREENTVLFWLKSRGPIQPDCTLHSKVISPHCLEPSIIPLLFLSSVNIVLAVPLALKGFTYGLCMAISLVFKYQLTWHLLTGPVSDQAFKGVFSLLFSILSHCLFPPKHLNNLYLIATCFFVSLSALYSEGLVRMPVLLITGF